MSRQPIDTPADVSARTYVRRRRQDLGITVEWVAAAMTVLGHNWLPGTVSALELGMRRFLSLQELVDLCVVLGCQLPDFEECAPTWSRSQVDELVEELRSKRNRHRSEQRAYKSLHGGRTPSDDELASFLSTVRAVLGRDLSTARQELIDQGQSPTWAGRRLIEQLATSLGATPDA